MNDKKSGVSDTRPEPETLLNEKRLAILLAEAYPAPPLQTSLRERVAAESAEHRALSAKRLQERRMRLRLTAISAVLLLCLGGMVTWPRWVAAKALQRMETAIKDVRNAHVVYWQIAPDGTRTHRSEAWFEGSKVRQEDTDLSTNPPRLDGVRLFVNGKYWTYQPQSGRVAVRRDKGFYAFNSSGFSIASMHSDYARWGWSDQIRVLDEVVIDGRPTRRVSIEPHEPARAGRILFLVDAQTDLPYRTEVQLKTKTGWTTLQLIEMRYDEPLDSARVFTPDFPRTAQWVDEDADRAHLRERLAKGIAEREASGGRRIVLRDFRVNEEGDVFLLYTAGKRWEDVFDSAVGVSWRGQDWSVTISDDQGNRYVRHISNYMESRDFPDNSLAMVYRGDRLEGNAWTPWTPKTQQRLPWKPRRFTVTFHVDPRNLHGKQDEETWRANRSEVVTFVLPVKKPQAVRVPDYASFLHLMIDEKSLLEARMSVREQSKPTL